MPAACDLSAAPQTARTPEWGDKDRSTPGQVTIGGAEASPLSFDPPEELRCET